MPPVLQVGIDPAKKQCVAVVVDQQGNTRSKSIRFAPDRDGIAQLIRRVQAIDPEAEAKFFLEASGRNWYVPAALVRQAGHHISLIPATYTAEQRKSSSRYAKSDAKDAEAIARAPFNMGAKAQHPADIPEGSRLNLQLLCRHRHTLQQDATAIKQRVLDWLGLTTPGLTDVIGAELAPADRQFVSKYPVVAKVLRLGKDRLHDFLQRRAQGEVDDATVEALFELARRAYSPRDLDDKLVGEQIGMELQRLELIEKHIQKLNAQIDKLMQKCDPQGLARSLPGFGPVVAAIMVAEAGTDVSRFPDDARFASWTGLTPKASGSNGKHKEGLPITKAGRSIVKWALYMAANVARIRDPELQTFYQRLRDNGKHHNVAVNAVAHKLARIYYAVMSDQRPFEKRPPQPLDRT